MSILRVRVLDFNFMHMKHQYDSKKAVPDLSYWALLESAP